MSFVFRPFAETMRAFEKQINNNRIKITAAPDAMKGLLWQGLSLPHQPRRKRGGAMTEQGNPAK
jgi:hypothetical protein